MRAFCSSQNWTGAQVVDPLLELGRIERRRDPLADAGNRRPGVLHQALQEIEARDHLREAACVGHCLSP
jgi:hypothetical protein